MDICILNPAAAGKDFVGIREIEGELTVYSSERGTVEYSEVYAFRTNVAIVIPEGKVGLLVETQPMGARGVTVCGKLVTEQDLGELRVAILNNHRDAFIVPANSPIARLLILDKQEEELDEISLQDLQKLVEERRQETLENDEAKAKADQHGASVTNGPGRNPILDPAFNKAEEDRKAGEKAWAARQENMIPNADREAERLGGGKPPEEPIDAAGAPKKDAAGNEIASSGGRGGSAVNSATGTTGKPVVPVGGAVPTGTNDPAKTGQPATS